jgi:hypothetical protein
MGDINHHIAHANDRDAPANGKLPLAERRQMVVVIHQVFGVDHSDGIFARQPETLGPLGPSRTNQGIETECLEVSQGQYPLFSHTTVAIVIHLWIRQNSPKLLAQTLLHFMLGGKHAIFGQPTGFDIAVEQHHMRPSLGQFLGSIQPGWTSADNANQVPAICLCVRHTASLPRWYIPLMLAASSLHA